MLQNLVLFILVLEVVPGIQAQDSAPGRVLVGQNENDTTQLYSYNENFLTEALFIPVILNLVNTTTGDPIEYTHSVNVTCQLTPTDDFGFSSVIFDSVIGGPNDITFLDIPFTIITPGRATIVQCWGESQVAANEEPQFTKDESISPEYAFEIRPAGVVNVFNPLLVLPNKPLNLYTPSAILLELSDDPLSNVSINCQLNTTGIQDPLIIAFWPQPRIVQAGEKRVIMSYNVTAKGNAVPFYCTAESDPIGAGPEIQFDIATSIGTRGVVAIAEGAATLFPEATTLETTQMTAILVLNDIPVTETTFYCTIQVVNSTEEANNIAADQSCLGPTLPEIPNPPTLPPFVTEDENATAGPTTTSTAPPTTTTTTTTTGPSTTTGFIPITLPPDVNITGEWVLDNNEITFEPGKTLYQTITMSRTLEVKKFKEEILVTQCCAPENLNSNSPQFVNVTTTMMTVAYNTPPFPINWTEATTENNLNVETPILKPGYVNVAPCPCDIKQGGCDVDCCCDTDCSADELDTFTCIPGVLGGNPPPPATYNCDVRNPLQESWFPFMCVQFDNTAFLGYYYFNKDLLRSQSDVNAALQTYGGEPSFSFDPDLVPEEVNSDYREGSSIKTGFQRDTLEVTYDTGVNYRLTLPARTWTGQCVWTSPVQFLVDDNQECVRKMKESLCSNESPLNALNYAQSSLWSGQAGAEVLRQAGSQVIADTNVNYLCADNNKEYTSKYFKSADTINDVMPANQVFTFNYTLPLNEYNDTDCNFDLDTGAYVCVNQAEDDTPAPISVPPRCSFDDGFTRPPAPVYDSTTNICYNAVVDVKYNFVWSGQDILYLNATVILADIPLETEKVINITVPYTDYEVINNETVPVSRVNYTEETLTFATEFTQMFNTKFESYPIVVELNDTTVENLTQTLTQTYMRSGNPGYDTGLPVISGVEVKNDTDGDFMYFNANDSVRLSVWEPRGAGLCDTAGRQVAAFGENTITSCVLRLSAAELDDCDNLRKLILNRQDNMMPSSFISIGGNPSQYNTNDWTQVFREDVSSIINITERIEPTAEANLTDTTTLSENATADPFLPTTENPFFINWDAFFNTITSPYREVVTGRCPNITSGITANIMYAQVGQASGKAIYQIVGANIEYTLSTWQMYCAGALGGACYGNESYVEQDGTIKIQPFTLTTAVNYIKVPAQPPAPPTEFEQRNSYPSYLCKSDSCWRELFYPWTKYNLGDQETYALVMGLLFLIYGIGLVLIIRPISKWG